MPAWLPAAISAVGGLLSSGANAISSRAANNRSWRQTKQLFGMQQADRNAQNVYNSPANQVALLKSAGLSPASFYGGAAQSAGSAGVAQPGSPEVNTPDLATPLSSGVNAATEQLMSQRQLDINNRLADSQINLNSANAIKALYSGRLDAWDLRQRDRMQNELDEKIRNDVRQGAENVKKTAQETARLAFDLDYEKEVRDMRKALLGAQTEHERMAAFASEWNGKVSQYQRQYMDEHGRQVPSDAWTSLLAYLMDKTGLNLPDFSVFNQSPTRGLANAAIKRLGYFFDENWRLQRIPNGGSR